MPAILVHYTFAYKHMRDEARPYEKAVCLGSQGPDCFFFYGFNLKSKKQRANKKGIQEYGHWLHRQDISDIYPLFFEYADKSEKKDLVYAYVEGLLLHYCVDRNCHGFVFSRAGDNIGDENDKTNWGVKHIQYEGMLDYLIGRKAGTWTTKTYKFLALNDEDLKEISKAWKYVNEKSSETEGFDELTFYKAVKDFRFVRRFIDSCGPLSGGFVRMVAGKDSVPYGLHLPNKMPKHLKDYDFMNAKNAEWKDPYSGEVHTENFPTLIHKSFPLYASFYTMLDKAKNGEDVKDEFKALVNNIDHESAPIGTKRKYRSPIWKDVK